MEQSAANNRWQLLDVEGVSEPDAHHTLHWPPQPAPPCQNVAALKLPHDLPSEFVTFTPTALHCGDVQSFLEKYVI